MGFSYLQFEERFRGASDVVREEQRQYLRFFEAGPVVDLGCGRGEFLELLRERAIPCWGIDSEPAMVEAARGKGVDARQERVLDHLAGLAPESLGGIFMCHVIEHMPRPDVLRFVELAASRLRDGGSLVIETLNPQCVFAHAPFTMDLSHEWPIHPQTLQFLLEGNGFEAFDLVYRQYLPPDTLQLSLAPAETAFERSVAESMQKLQLIVDLAFKNFIYALAAKKRATSK